MMNFTFDLLNGRRPIDAIKLEDWFRKRKALEDFLNIINNTERLYHKFVAEEKTRRKEAAKKLRETEKEKKKLEEVSISGPLNRGSRGKRGGRGRGRGSGPNRSNMPKEALDETKSDSEKEDEDDDDLNDAEEEIIILEKKDPVPKKRKPANKINIHMFASPITMDGWRMTVTSIIALIEECFGAGYRYALTGKWNQDPLEVYLN